MISAVHLAEDATPLEKYVFKPSLGSSHHWALSFLRGQIAGKRLLDIGAGGGGMGMALGAETLGDKGAAELTAVEIDSGTRSAIAPIYKGGVHQSSSNLPSASFDVILLLDVLEHMADPFAYMKEVERLLAPGGMAVISVPNIAHWSVRFSLFFLGRFEYASRGILDKTHLQFFTRSRFRSLLSAPASCRITTIAASIAPVELVLPALLTNNSVFKGLSSARAACAQVFPGIMAYQHLGVIQKCAQ